jgi:hypothetical protein
LRWLEDFLFLIDFSSISVLLTFKNINGYSDFLHTGAQKTTNLGNHFKMKMAVSKYKARCRKYRLANNTAQQITGHLLSAN